MAPERLVILAAELVQGCDGSRPVSKFHNLGYAKGAALELLPSTTLHQLRRCRWYWVTTSPWMLVPAPSTTTPGRQEDFVVGQEKFSGLEIVPTSWQQRRYLPDTELFAGQHVFQGQRIYGRGADRAWRLTASPRLFNHSYPPAASKTPIIFRRALTQWGFIQHGTEGLHQTRWKDRAYREGRYQTARPERLGACLVKTAFRRWSRTVLTGVSPVSVPRGVPISLFVHKETPGAAGIRALDAK